MYFTCDIPFTDQQRVKCQGTLIDVLDTSSTDQYLACSVPFDVSATFLRCSGVRQSDIFQNINPQYYLSTLDSYIFSGGRLQSPVNYQSSLVSTLQVQSSGTHTLLSTLTPTDFNDLSIHVTTVFLLAFGIRLIRSMFVQTR